MSEPPLTPVDRPALVVAGLVKRYGDRAVVDSLDLVADRGAVTAVLGPNGAGKTTTLEICEGLRSADAGTVQVLGRAPHDQALRSRVGVMLQEGGVYGSVTPREALRHAASLYRQAHPVADLIETLGLGEVATVPTRRLSGGQRQRLGVALAIVGRPELVFLDEPSAGLDPQSRRAVWDLINALRAAGVAVVLTTHYLEEAEQLADHVVIVDHGRTIASGRPQDLVATAASSVLRFTTEPGLDVTMLQERLPAVSTVAETTPGTYLVTTARLADAITQVTSWCADNGVSPTSINSEQRTLEDVFLDLTGEELRS
ncbi:MAG: ABC transporter ATP-binding protein [Actinomycetia bacterium]|nr:ABC transporter ATP-binding protein [Actinomycetes bacterium]